MYIFLHALMFVYELSALNPFDSLWIFEPSEFVLTNHKFRHELMNLAILGIPEQLASPYLIFLLV